MVWPMVAVAAVGMAAQMGGGIAAANASKAAARRQAALADAQMREEIKRKQRSNVQLKGEIKANIYASGVKMEGSAKQHLTTQAELMKEDIWMMNRARKDTVRAMEKGAAGAYNAAMWQTAATGIAGAAKIGGMVANASPGTDTTTTGLQGGGINMAGGYGTRYR